MYDLYGVFHKFKDRNYININSVHLLHIEKMLIQECNHKWKITRNGRMLYYIIEKIIKY